MYSRETGSLPTEMGNINPLALDNTPEVTQELYTTEELNEKLMSGEAVYLKGKKENCLVGYGMLVKVNTSVGVGSRNPAGYKKEIDKIDYLSSVEYRPDIMMDLSIVSLDSPLYKYIIEKVGIPVGTLPHYLCFDANRGIDDSKFLDEVEKQAMAGVSFMTFHPTPTRSLVEKSTLLRKTPFTSRGGGLVIFDIYNKSRKENVISDLFPEILDILKRNKVVLSIGSTFRPANIFDALDTIHKEEFERQGVFIEMAKKAGVPVIFEGVGHMTLDKIAEYAEMVKQYKIPFMPLGPIPTEIGVGMDHISSVIGSTFMAQLGAAHIFNTITREEHTGGIPSLESIDEALRSVRIAGHIVDVSKFTKTSSTDRLISDNRAKKTSCVVSEVDTKEFTEKTGCSRCGYECPLRIVGKVVGQIKSENDRK